MLRAAQAAGLSDLCATDHCDLLDLDGGRVTGLDWAPILTQYQAARGDCPAGVKLRLGLELGGAPVDPDCAAAILSGADLDFVIGSIHNLSPAKGGKDFYFLDYTTPRASRQFQRVQRGSGWCKLHLWNRAPTITREQSR